MSPSSLRGRLRALHREVIARRRPHGVVNWRYLGRCPDERVRVHRALWWASGDRWPRSLWCGTEALLWLRWVLLHGPLAVHRAVSRLGQEVASSEGLPMARQRLAVARVVLGWGIPPGEAYFHGLHRTPDAAADFVYESETAAYHGWRNRGAEGLARSLATLQDKLALADLLRPLGVPVVPTAVTVPRADAGPALGVCMGTMDDAFCKARSGNRGRGAFAAWRREGGLAGRTFDGRDLATTADVEEAWRVLVAMDDALVQPRLENHSALAPLADEAITVRCVTRREGNRVAGILATLEIPDGAPGGGTDRRSWSVLPVDIATGEPRPFPEGAFLPRGACARLDRAFRVAEAIGRLPGWDLVQERSRRAHEALPGPWAIAWDWVITPDGPLLLEGNGGWGLGMLQVLRGGLLARNTGLA